jgi:acyl-CoA synthetase (AMP-forming)/AMP-acid ligase II
LSDDELLAFCRSRLAGYKLPKQVIRVDELPRTASGKVRKDLLRAGLRPGS